MKTKTTKPKSKAIKKPETNADMQTSALNVMDLKRVDPPGIITYGPDGSVGLRPFPSDLLREAEMEPDYQDLSTYFEVMLTLRRKGFSFREIAEWLSERGVEADHNAVYRVYNNNLPEEGEREEVMRQQAEDEKAQHKAMGFT